MTPHRDNIPPAQDSLDRLLHHWEEATPAAESVEAEVWRRIAAAEAPSEAPGLLGRIRALFARPSFSIAFAAACLLLGLFLVELRNSRQQALRSAQLAQSYLRIVDPLYEPDASPNNSQIGENLDTLLAWMKSDLQLDENQLARIRSVHEQLKPRLLDLAGQVAQMQHTLAEFEKERSSENQVNFLEFASYAEKRRRLDRECNESTRRLISEASDVMSPEQRQHYLNLLHPAIKATSGGSL